MHILIVVDDPRSWKLRIPDVEVLSARTYLTDPRYTQLRSARVINLCRSYRYQSLGYYVSLLAAARKHKPMPETTTVQDLKSQTIIRVASDELDELIQTSLSSIRSAKFMLSIYFGRNLAKRHERLSQHLFALFHTPLLRAYFTHSEKKQRWFLQNVEPISTQDIPESHHDFVVEAARKYLAGRWGRAPGAKRSRYDLAILVSPTEQEPPSDKKALQRFARAAESMGLSTEFIEKEDFGRLGEFDGLFIRETTSVNHHTYRFAQRANAQGLMVVDDPESILRCANKVFLAELMQRHHVQTPRTMIVHRDNAARVADTIGLPCVLKEPDNAFSRGVVKAATQAELTAALSRILNKSEMVIAQEFLPTPFDWRIGVFDRQPLYACKYFMARQHWQILKRDANGIKQAEGKWETLPVEHAPTAVLRVALRAANLIGDGFYGVDLKQVGDEVYVIEVNDNPSIEAGVEDQVLKMELYLRIMRVFLRRIEDRKKGVYV
ncbi:MAG: RimK family protein [Kiritimatiellae bacterium]|nr:RimK family protein [Kiritimatiellia bacterium]